MKYVIFTVAFLVMFAVPAQAMELSAPEVPESGETLMPYEPESFTDGLFTILKEASALLQPALVEASGVCLGLIAVVILVSLVRNLPGASENVAEMTASLAIAVLLLQPANSLIQLGVDTVRELSDYGKLLLPVMTAAMAAQGGSVSSGALYTGTVMFDALLTTLISSVIVPMIYVYLCLAAANSASGQDVLGKLRDFIKWLMTWSLKIVLYVFMGYMGITGVVSGSADAAAVKATKLTISGMVPVVGGILSDASEAILVSAGVMKSAAGVYGLLAILAVWVGPFIRIGAQYLLLKLTGAICGVFGSKRTVGLIQNFTAAMGLLLAMTGAVCLMLLISTVCFMKGVG